MRIVVEDLSVVRGGICAVEDIGFIAETGGWTGVVGANGSGKTSLLRALAGRLRLDGGRILIDGIDRTEDREWRARAIGFAPEAVALPSNITGAELFAICGGQERGVLSGLWKALDFEWYLGRRMGALSAGMRQRLAIFSAFVGGSRAVILDEPFNWLDPVCAYDTRQALRALVEQEGFTLLTALHDMTTLVGHCDSGLLLSEGRIRRYLNAYELKSGAADFAQFEQEMIQGLRSAGRPD